MTTLLQRLAAAMGRVDYVQKEKKAGMRYSIVSHDTVTAKVRPVLLGEGVIYYPLELAHAQNGNRTEVYMVVRFVSVDDATDFIDVPTLGYGIDDQDKGPGKAISYAVKYALLKALGLETGDDPDTEQDAAHKPAQAAYRADRFYREPAAEEMPDAPEGPHSATHQAWMDGIRDALPENANPRIVAEATAKQICVDLKKYKTARWVGIYVEGKQQVIDRLRDHYPDLHAPVRDAVADAYARVSGEPYDAADYVRAG